MRECNSNFIRLFDDAVSSEKQYEFQRAKQCYQKIVTMHPGCPEADIARERIRDMDVLTGEMRLYQRIHHNAKRILNEIGMDISASPVLMDLLLAADAIDTHSEQALFIPIKANYLESCLAAVPREMPEDPGINAFGTGATPPFLHRTGRDDLAPANREEFEKIVRTASEYADTLGIFSIPVATDKSISVYESSRLMEAHFPDLKMTYTRNMSDQETAYFQGRDDWMDGTSLITSMTVMPNMVVPFIRSAQAGNNLLLLDLTIAGASGPASPEALLTQIHAQVLFMMMLAQTIRPGIGCVHGGIPDVLGVGGDLDYSDPGQPIINSAMARLNLWVTGFPSAQSGGSTSIVNDIPAAVEESERSRNTLRLYGVHILRHAMGAMGNLNYFSLEKFIEDCKRERTARLQWLRNRHDFIVPLHLPEDPDAVSGIREIAEKGGAKYADHTLGHVDAFARWQKVLTEAGEKKAYFPELKDAATFIQEDVKRGPEEEAITQLQETFLKN